MNKDQWERLLKEAREKTPERKPEFTTISGLTLEPSYFGLDAEWPGAYPFTRGIDPILYRSDLWVMGQYSGFGSAEEANQRYRYLLSRGQTGFSIALDLPTQMGFDSDHDMSEGEVGKVGVALNSLEDMQMLLKDIPLQKVRQMRTTANATGPIMAAMFIATMEKDGTDPKDIKILIQNDSLKEFFARGAYIFPPEPSAKLSVDVIEYCSKHLPGWTPLSISGYHIRDSGATAQQEVAFAFANGVAYIEEALKRGLDVDEFAGSFYVFFASHIDLLEEVAKFRAARRLWARLMKERFGAKLDETMKLRIFAYTMGGALTAQQPLNNVARVTIEALAAVLGGVQTLATSSYDEALSIPSEEAVTVALRTQQIIAHESGVTGTVDPLGGSYAIEALTDQSEERMMEYINTVDRMGGAIAAIERGYFQREIGESAYRWQKDVEENKRTVVGVNEFVSDKSEKVPVFRLDPAIEQRQVARLTDLRRRRDNRAVAAALTAVEQAARKGDNTIPSLVEAIKAYATLGEICDVFRDLWGTYQEPAVF